MSAKAGIAKSESLTPAERETINLAFDILLPPEQLTLKELEDLVERRAADWIEAGRALDTIRESRVYRQQYGSFDKYCRARHGMSGSRASQLIISSRIYLSLKFEGYDFASGDPIPSFESPYQKRTIAAKLRWEVWERDDFTCHYCGIRRDLGTDHMQPERLGGKDDLSNLVTCCRTCNSRKGKKTYREFLDLLAKEGAR